jgi:hypothetical protein
MLNPTPDSLSGGYAPSEPARPKSANRQHASGERTTRSADAEPEGEVLYALRAGQWYSVSAPFV